MTKPDEWNDTGAFHYRDLPETSVSKFFGEDRDMLRITNERGQYWMLDTRYPGETPYASLKQAKAEGDKIIEDLLKRQEKDLLADAGLSPLDWKVSFKDGLAFEHKTFPRQIVAETECDHEAWSAVKEDISVATFCCSVLDALSSFDD